MSTTDNPRLTTGSLKYTTLGVRVMESYTEINLYSKNFLINSILLRYFHLGIDYTDRRNKFVPLCDPPHTRVFLSSTSVSLSRRKMFRSSLRSPLIGAIVGLEPAGRRSWHSVISGQPFSGLDTTKEYCQDRLCMSLDRKIPLGNIRSVERGT